ncbi:MAG: hypothetical protein H0T82_07730 [Sphingomonas sp.]|jgi:hypothetical protein|nr:hypothetical protein [Sphingomonas sp.]
MENDAASLTLPDLDERDLIAIEGILARTIRAQDQIVHDREQMKVLNERIAQNTKIRSGAYEALKTIFGFDDPPEEDKNRWDVVCEVMGTERYSRTITLARGKDVPGLLSKMEDGQFSSAKPVVAKRSIPIRTVILEYLHTAGEQGAKAAQVRQHLADAHGITVHEKTPGMTLYRLLKEGLVSRNGRTWYAKQVTENDENEASSGRAGDASETALAAQ